MNAYDIILQPWLTEKSMEARTTEQRLEFIVRRGATKKQIARAVEAIFDVEDAKVNVRNTKHGKHASVKVILGQTVKLSPQPQLSFTFGLLN